MAKRRGRRPDPKKNTPKRGGPSGRGGSSGKQSSEPRSRSGARRKRPPRDGELLPRVPIGGGKAKRPRPDQVERRDAPASASSSSSSFSSPSPADPADRADPETMRRIFAEAGLDDLDDVQLNLFWQYHLRLKERNREINLTRIHRFRDIVVKHFVDCALVGRLTDLPSPLIDLGSGGGFPGVPLKILHPDVEIILAEGRKLRVAFLEEVRRCLRLPKLYIHGRRIHPDGDAPPAGGVVTRAVERIEQTLPRVEGCVAPGGRALFMKGPGVDPEIEATAAVLADRWRLAEDHAYVLPTTDHARRLVVYERIA